VNQFLSSGNVLFNELRDLVKERSEIEHEYAMKLDQLAKKYQNCIEKKVDKSLFGLKDTNGNTLYKALQQMILCLQVESEKRLNYAQILGTDLSESIKSLALRKDEARVRVSLFIYLY
jgi:hypothetical protein